MKITGAWKVGVGIGLGYLLGRYLIPLATGAQVNLPPPGPVAPDNRPAINRIAGDMINTCDKLRPVLRQLELDTNDGSLSVPDIARLAGQINQLT